VSSDDLGQLQREPVSFCSDLIRINTSNPTHPESEAAAYVEAALLEVGIVCERFEPAPGRVSLVARIPGREASLSPLLIHTHLDTVPADPADWTVDPFAGLVQDGYVWGRGAVDMKGMVGAVVAVVRELARSGRPPRRDLVLAFFADEEAGGEWGAGYVTRTRPDLFAGCEDAIGEIGGFSYRVSADQRCYLVSAAEKGVLWAQLHATGRPGHGSMINDDNAVSAVCEAVARIAGHEFAESPTPTVQLFLDDMADLLGLSNEPRDALLDKLGPLSRMIRASLRDTLNPTTISGGYKVNVIPGRASATVDGRFLPGHEQALRDALHELAGDRLSVEEIFTGAAVESPWDVPLVAAISRALRREDDTATVVPYMGTAFTDAKWLSGLGIRCYGFCPLLLPDDLDFTALFHGPDERVPVAALEFCASVLHHLLHDY
jgi:acetylornithine deacetylase/succinyl-diaminopimelate desuccinylase-like protein